MTRSERARKIDESPDLETPRPEDGTDPSVVLPAQAESGAVESVSGAGEQKTTGDSESRHPASEPDPAPASADHDDTNPGFSLPDLAAAALLEGATPGQPADSSASDPSSSDSSSSSDDDTNIFAVSELAGGSANDSASDAALRPFRLYVVAGPMSGSDFELIDEVVIGRSPGVPVHLPDSSVSRRHARLTRSGDSAFVLTDLESGNGSLVNGEPVQEATIRHGDTVTFGDSVLRLVDSAAPADEISRLSAPLTPVATPGPVSTNQAGAAPSSPMPESTVVPGSDLPPEERETALAVSPAASPSASNASHVPSVETAHAEATEGQGSGDVGSGGLSPGRKKLYIGVAAALVFFFAIAFLLKGDGDAPQTAERGEVVFDEAESLKQQALERARARQWAEAVGLLEEARSHRDDPDIRRLLTGSKAEAAHQQAVAGARDLLESSQFSQARTQLNQVPETADFYDEAQALLAGIPAALDGAVATASSLFDDGDREGAKALVGKVLAADSSHAAALALRERLEEPEPEPVVAQTTPRPRRPRTVATTTTTEVVPEKPSGPAPEAVAALLAGELNRALRVADATGGPENEAFARNLRTFDSNLREGLGRVRNERYLEAVTPLTRALDLHREMTGGKSGKLGDEAGKQLANAHYLLGLDSKGDEQLPRASSHFRRALRADPNHALAKRQLGHIEARANNLYIDAYTMENMDKDRARQLYRLVIETLPASNDTHQKAKRRLEGL